MEAIKEQEAEALAVSLRSEIDSLEVVDQKSYDLANVYNKRAYEGKKAFHAWFDPIDEASKKARQAVIAQGKKIDEPFDYIIKVTGSKAATWMRAEKARIEEEKRKAEADARRKAEEEQLRAAEILEAEGLTAAAEAMLDSAPVVEKIVIDGPAKDNGVYYRDVWGAEVVSLSDLVKAVAEGKAPLLAIQANEAYLGQWARMSKGTETIPGVKVTNTPIQCRRS